MSVVAPVRYARSVIAFDQPESPYVGMNTTGLAVEPTTSVVAASRARSVSSLRAVAFVTTIDSYVHPSQNRMHIPLQTTLH